MGLGIGAPKQKILEHSLLAMTTHYLCSVIPEEDTFNAMKAVLKCSKTPCICKSQNKSASTPDKVRN